MELVIRHFNELTANELFQIVKLRISIFVVEQHCPYQEVDDADRNAYHIYLKDNEGILAYLRLLPSDANFKKSVIGRVIAVKRRCWLGSQILSEGIKFASQVLGSKSIDVEAQVYACGLYQKAGFVKVSSEFLEDGIPHIKMTLQVYCGRGMEKAGIPA